MDSLKERIAMMAQVGFRLLPRISSATVKRLCAAGRFIGKLGTFAMLGGLAYCLLLASSRARAVAVKPPALASYDWSPISAHSLAAKPPPKSLVQSFVNGAWGNAFTRVCSYRFADLRHSGNLSLIVSIDSGGTGGCNSSDIFDKTATGFEDYSSDLVFTGHSDVQDINHDGKLEFILWAPLTGSDDIGQECDWPLVFAWKGSSYAEVSGQYKRYYERYLNDLNRRIAAASEQTPAPMYTTIPRFTQSNGGPPPGPAFVRIPVPASSRPVESAPNSADTCTWVDAAKTEAFLGEQSGRTMNYAIKASESGDPYDRKLAAVMFSLIGTGEAQSYLQGLTRDPDSSVAQVAKIRLGFWNEPEPADLYRELKGEPVRWPVPIP